MTHLSFFSTTTHSFLTLWTLEQPPRTQSTQFKMSSSTEVGRKEWEEKDIVAIRALVNAGMSRRNIASQLSIPESTVGRISRKVKNDPKLGFIHKKRSGAPRKVTATSERRLVRHVRQNPFSTINELTTPTKSGYDLHRHTIRKVLNNNGIGSFQPRTKPYLSPSHAKKRLDWARDMTELRVGDIDNLRTIIFTDESTFEVGQISSAPRVLRKKGEAYLPQHLRPSFKSGRSTISVWGAISYDFKGPLVFMPQGERMTSQTYINGILSQQGYDFYEKISHEHGFAVWQQDGAPCHTAKGSMQWMKEMGMEVLPWPAQSPDVNPIENIWSILKTRISKRRHHSTTIPALKAALADEWEKLTIEDIRPVVGSMRERISLLVTAKGHSLKY